MRYGDGEQAIAAKAAFTLLRLGRIHTPRDPSIFGNKIFLRGVTIDHNIWYGS